MATPHDKSDFTYHEFLIGHQSMHPKAFDPIKESISSSLAPSRQATCTWLEALRLIIVNSIFSLT
jgi:hypothetical protein